MIKLFLANLFFKILHSSAYAELLRKRDDNFLSSFKHLGGKPLLSKPYIIKNPQYISIGKNFSSLYNLRMEAWDRYIDEVFTPIITIGDNVSINTDCHIGCINRVTIGNNVLMASRIYISDHFHGEITQDDLALAPVQRKLYSKGPVIIEDNVWIGEGVCIMPGVKIGKNAIIGANAVITKNIPCNAVVGGNPAKIIKLLS